MYHNKQPPSGSTHLRVRQLLKYWDEAKLYTYGEKPDVMIFQKVYATQDYRFPLNFPGIKILDMCDPDWLGGQTGIKETIDYMDAVTCSSNGLALFLRQLTDKPVIIIPDRFDVTALPAPKVHEKRAETVVWFGYRHNADTLKPALPLINELGLNLLVIAEDDPLAWQWLPNIIGDNFRKEKYQFVKYIEDNIYYDLQRADFAILPHGQRPIDPFKSNNKSIKAILAGLPVAHVGDDVRTFMDAEARRDRVLDTYEKTKVEYDVRKSVEQFKYLIALIKQEGRDGECRP